MGMFVICKVYVVVYSGFLPPSTETVCVAPYNRQMP